MHFTFTYRSFFKVIRRVLGEKGIIIDNYLSALLLLVFDEAGRAQNEASILLANTLQMLKQAMARSISIRGHNESCLPKFTIG